VDHFLHHIQLLLEQAVLVLLDLLLVWGVVEFPLYFLLQLPKVVGEVEIYHQELQKTADLEVEQDKIQQELPVLVEMEIDKQIPLHLHPIKDILEDQLALMVLHFLVAVVVVQALLEAMGPHQVGVLVVLEKELQLLDHNIQ
jgi:hypothetical protein